MLVGADGHAAILLMTGYAALPSAAMWLSRTALQRGKFGSLASTRPAHLFQLILIQIRSFHGTEGPHGGQRWLDSATFSGPSFLVTRLLTDRHASARLIFLVSQTWKTWSLQLGGPKRSSCWESLLHQESYQVCGQTTLEDWASGKDGSGNRAVLGRKSLYLDTKILASVSGQQSKQMTMKEAEETMHAARAVVNYFTAAQSPLEPFVIGRDDTDGAGKHLAVR